MPIELPAWIVYFARLGQLAKGVIFLSIGLLSAQGAWDGGGKASDSRGALRSVAEQPFGRTMLFALIAGLVCYIFWRLLEAFADVNGRGRNARGLFLRVRSLGVAVVYCGITAAAVRTLLGTPGHEGGSATQDWAQRLLDAPFGGWLLIGVGLGVIAGGVVKIHHAFTGKFEKKLELSELRDATRRWVLRLCAFGLSARGIVFGIIGIFFIQAGMESNAGKARGLSGALEALHAQPYGRALFAIVAAGLAAYGCYCCLRAWYGRWGER